MAVAPAGADVRAAAIRITGMSLTTTDAERLAAFYQALGFDRGPEERRSGGAFAALMRLAGAAARVIPLTLGAERVELVEFAERGAPHPRGSASNDPRFQHFAIVASSIDAAYDRLRRCRGWTAITRPAPQRLPPSAGGVVAFKFRDPEGHPLELLQFPDERMPHVWRARRDGPRAGVRTHGACLGIDHSAIVVTDTARSIGFYARLGFARTGGSLNRGREQARLDDLPEPVVQVTALAPSSAEPPHLELLRYRAPRTGEALCAPLPSNDIAATRLLIADRRGGTTERGSRLIHDPDGHALVLEPRD